MKCTLVPSEELLGTLMNLANHKMRGFFEHKLDAKGRVSVPVSWRPDPGSSVFLLKAESYGVSAIKVMSEEAMERKYRQIEEAEDLTPKDRDRLSGLLSRKSHELQVNDQGKLTVPKAWAEEAGLELPGAVALVGRGNNFEMMTTENYEVMSEREEAETAALNERFGII
ncbi:MAG: division/cell wall cluster transcriptional repressor MraZ [Verrucomicrobiales bacterium]